MRKLLKLPTVIILIISLSVLVIQLIFFPKFGKNLLYINVFSYEQVVGYTMFTNLLCFGLFGYWFMTVLSQKILCSKILLWLQVITITIFIVMFLIYYFDYNGEYRNIVDFRNNPGEKHIIHFSNIGAYLSVDFTFFAVSHISFMINLTIGLFRNKVQSEAEDDDDDMD